jgi:hypothetical protein
MIGKCDGLTLKLFGRPGWIDHDKGSPFEPATVSHRMTAAVSQVTSDIERMASTFDHIASLSKDISGFRDGPHLREQLEVDVKSIMDLSHGIKRSLTQLRERDEPEADDAAQRFEALRGRVQSELPPVVTKLKSRSADTLLAETAAADYTEGLLRQTQLDGDVIEILEQHVNQILLTMREVREIFGATLEELQKQKHLVTSIETITSDARDEMHKGNEILEEAQEQQKGGTKCLLWVVIVLVLVAAAVILIILSQTIWKKKKPSPSPSGDPTPGPQWF